MSDIRSAHFKGIIILIILLFISFALMGFSQTKITFQFKTIAFAVFYPFQYVGVSSISFVKDFFTSIKNNRYLKEELAQTKKLLEEYERTQYEFEEIKAENERLRRLIGIQSELEYETVIAENINTIMITTKILHIILLRIIISPTQHTFDRQILNIHKLCPALK